MTSLKIAVLVDGDFFLKRRRHLLNGKGVSHSPADVAKDLHTYALRHVGEGHQLYRIFYYDADPLKKKVHNPITHQAIDFEKSDLFKFRTAFFEELRSLRKMALRLGKLTDWNRWQLPNEVIKKLCAGTLTWDQLTGEEFTYDVRQKGVDSRIAVDIASMAYKKQVDRIVLIAGDSDFIPAAKLARREGIDFILDPLHHHTQPELSEHIDGKQSKQLGPKW
ncbi:MAG: NYN domain-containing protein [Aeromonas sp.]